MNLKRIKDLPPDFPVSAQTLYKWQHHKKYPKLLVKFGGSLCVDLDEIEGVVRDAQTDKAKKEGETN
jgi:hypothetical protein